MAMGDPDADQDKLSDRGRRPADRARRTPTCGTSTAASTRRWTRCAARRPTRSSTTSPVVSAAGSRCASCCSSSPTCCSSTSPPTTSTPSRCSGSRATSSATPAPSWPITHDRYFLDNVAEWILELDRGKAHPYEGNYSTYLETKKDRLKIEGQKDAKRAKMLERELEWVRSNAKARQTKSRSRLARYEEMAAEADRKRKIDTSEINIPAGPRLGDIVLEAKGLAKGFDGRTLMHDLSFTLPRAGIVGVIGPNGVGKTTLFRMITGEEKPDDGELERRPDRQDLLRRPEPRRHRPEQERLGGRLRRPRLHQGRELRDELARLRRVVRLQGPRPAEEGRRAVRRRAQPAQPRADPEDGRQPAAARRADQRPRRRDPVSRSRTRCSTSPAVPWSPRTTGGSSTASPPTSWPGRATTRTTRSGSGSRATSPSYEENKVERLGIEAARPHRVTHRRLTRD